MICRSWLPIHSCAAREVLMPCALHALTTMLVRVLVRVLTDGVFNPVGFAAESEVLAQVMREAMAEASA